MRARCRALLAHAPRSNHKTRGCTNCDGATGTCTRCNAGLGLAANGTCRSCQVPGCQLCSFDAAACDWCGGRSGGFAPLADGSCSSVAAAPAALDDPHLASSQALGEAMLRLGRKWLLRGAADSAA